MTEILQLISDFRATKNGNIVYNMILYSIVIIISIKISDYITTRLGKRKDKSAIIWKYSRQANRVIIIALGIIGILSEIPSMSKITTTLIASSSIIVAAIGLAAQESMSNAISGMFIIVFKPFTVGDRVRLTQMGIVGIVTDINLRHTVITNFENNQMMIPNSVINKETIENYNIEDSSVCNFVDFFISYESNIDKAISILEEIIASHPLHKDNRTEEQKQENAKVVNVLIRDLTERGVNLRVGIWTYHISDSFRMCSDIRKEVLDRFRAEGIKIAIPVISINQVDYNLDKFKIVK